MPDLQQTAPDRLSGYPVSFGWVLMCVIYPVSKYNVVCKYLKRALLSFSNRIDEIIHNTYVKKEITPWKVRAGTYEATPGLLQELCNPTPPGGRKVSVRVFCRGGIWSLHEAFSAHVYREKSVWRAVCLLLHTLPRSDGLLLPLPCWQKWSPGSNPLQRGWKVQCCVCRAGKKTTYWLRVVMPD